MDTPATGEIANCMLDGPGGDILYEIWDDLLDEREPCLVYVPFLSIPLLPFHNYFASWNTSRPETLPLERMSLHQATLTQVIIVKDNAASLLLGKQTSLQ